MKHPIRRASDQRGVGLIEVLVTLLILSTSLMALAALQTRSLQYNHGAYLRSQANLMAYDLLDRVRVNRNAVADYNLGLGDTPVGTSLAATDLREWRANIAASLPGGRGAIACTDFCTVTIEWAEQNSSGDETENSTTFTYTTRIL
jgi:type IV pilus assembly protein PilV